MADAKRDQNSVPTLLGVSSVDGITPVTLYADPTTHRLLTDAAAGMSNPMTTGGDLIYGGVAGTPTRLANGSAGQVLTSQGTTLAPIWSSAGAGDMLLAGVQTVTGAKTFNDTKLILAGAGVGVATFSYTNSASSVTITFPATTGTVALTSQLTSGTVTASGGSLTANAVVLGAGTTDTKVSTGITTDGVAALTLGVNATTIGKVKMFGNTSGDVTIQPTAAAGTATVQTLPATTGTLVNRVTTGNGVSASNTDGALSFTLGAITPTTVNGNTFTTGTYTLTGTAGKTLSFTNTLTLSGTDSTTMTFPTTSKTLAANDGSNWTIASQAIGDILTATSTTAYGRVAAVAVGSVLISQGTGTAPIWSATPLLTSVDIGNADTTLSRSAAGQLAMEGVDILSTSNTKTVTNKRMQPRTSSTTTASTLDPDLSSANVYFRTTQTATLTVSAPIGTPVIGEVITMYIDSAGAQTLTMNATYVAFGAAFPATTTAGKTMMITAQYNGTNWKTTWANAV